MDNVSNAGSAQAAAKKQLNLLDLPIDILKGILNEVTVTNDLSSLALVNSALHELVTPLIYRDFNIVWNDWADENDLRTSVDSLTYGLTTLIMQDPSSRAGSRRGHYFSQFVKSFSFGECSTRDAENLLLTRDGGKMLNTLVAATLVRMPNLESFTWSLTIGVNRDIWQSLSFLGELGSPKLRHISVRFHDNVSAQQYPRYVQPHFTEESSLDVVVDVSFNGRITPSNDHERNLDIADHFVEHPNFSILSPMDSIGALDVDELEYLEELSHLLAKSAPILRSLRVGIATHLHSSGYYPHHHVRQTYHKDGAIGILFSKLRPESKSMGSVSSHSSQPSQPDAVGDHKQNVDQTRIDPQLALNATSEFGSKPPKNAGSDPCVRDESIVISCTPATQSDPARLKLDSLEMERFILSNSSLFEVIDWSHLTTLTILDSFEVNNLWSTLNDTMKPRNESQSSLMFSIPAESLENTGGPSRLRQMPSSPPAIDAPRLRYTLRLKRLYVDVVSPEFLTFIKTTLAPNTLELLFLRDSLTSQRSTSINKIFKQAIMPHRQSLTKLLLDCTRGGPVDRTVVSRRAQWALNRGMLTYIFSLNMMPALRELSFTISDKDWLFFLRQLPNHPTIRSLHLNDITDTHNRSDQSAYTLHAKAQQLLSILDVRRESNVAYIGLQDQCYRVCEKRVKPVRLHPANDDTSSDSLHWSDLASSSSDDEDDDDNPFQDEDEFEADPGSWVGQHVDDWGYSTLPDPPAQPLPTEPDLPNEEEPTGEQPEAEEELDDLPPPQDKVSLKLEEIHFFDEKIAIFGARHGRLLHRARGDPLLPAEGATDW